MRMMGPLLRKGVSSSQTHSLTPDLNPLPVFSDAVASIVARAPHFTCPHEAFLWRHLLASVAYVVYFHTLHRGWSGASGEQYGRRSEGLLLLVQ